MCAFTTAEELLHHDDVDALIYRRAMSLFATGVTVITTRTDAGPVGMTASAVTSLSLDPVMLLVCISSHLPTHDAIAACGRFGVNVMAEDDGPLALHFARPAPDKFAGVAYADRGGMPILDDSLAYFVCDVHERVAAGDHSIFIGSVACLGLRSDAAPLLYFAGRFGRLADDAHDELLKSWREGSALL